MRTPNIQQFSLKTEKSTSRVGTGVYARSYSTDFSSEKFSAGAAALYNKYLTLRSCDAARGAKIEHCPIEES